MKIFNSTLKNRLSFSLLILMLCLACLLYAALYFTVDLFIWLPVILLLVLLLGMNLVNYVYYPFSLLIESMETGLNCLRDDDFSISLTSLNYSEFKGSIDTYNQLADILRNERLELYQREILLDAIIQSTPMAIVLTTDTGIIVYNNNTARILLGHPSSLNSLNFESIYSKLPKDLREATENKQEGMYNLQVNDEKKIYHLTFQEFVINNQTHYLYLYKNLTAEVTKEELLIWKKVIKLISHELNNSLAPIQSLSHSAKKIIRGKPDNEILIDILETIDRRSKHLHQFIERYAKFSRLPIPSIKTVDLKKFVKNLEQLCDVTIHYEPTSVQDSQSIKFDATQLEQVIINLVKNAKESGSDEENVLVKLQQVKDTLFINVSDRGTGMKTEQLEQCLLPFFTTKSYGSGLGLALSNEIINAHNGKLKIINRAKGGLNVEIDLPINN